MATSILITGHRHLQDEAEVKKNILYSLNYFKEKEGEIYGISSMSFGADLLFAEACIETNIPLEVIFPFEKETFKNDFLGREEAWARVEEILLTATVTKPLFDKPANEEEKNNAYLLTGEALVQRADIVLAVWDKKKAHGKGGTADIVHFAESVGKEVHIIKSKRVAKDGEIPETDDLKKLDDNAVVYKKWRFMVTWILGIISGLLTILFFSIKGLFKQDDALHLPGFNDTQVYWLSVMEVSFLVISFISLNRYARKFKEKFLQQRRDTEYMRTVTWFKNAEVPVPSMDKINYKISSGILEAEKNIAATIPELKSGNLKNAKRMAWILAEVQVCYQSDVRKTRNERRLSISKKFLHYAKWIFIGTAAINFLLESFYHFSPKARFHEEYHYFVRYLLLLLIMLPPVYAAIEGVKYFGEYERQIEVADQTTKKLKQIQQSIVTSTASNFQEIVKQLRETLDIENSDWAMKLNEKHIEKNL